MENQCPTLFAVTGWSVGVTEGEGATASRSPEALKSAAGSVTCGIAGTGSADTVRIILSDQSW
jgi:hypothetical protein